ncbi:hypothetical protein BMS_1623 [Halobacteriovorax marinus SJ]|uniref:SGNH hydrolase-type esterase domain-containing protein n=1 Tax=Halobacteriovorax marinus (strain ATCC BAA-682 / DSM 15412 / SJ) TaxID=862908 RepID=E1X0X8_HALMS|nr:SGNH/GDSL hydrolase family protein [Halobacteriovorax marinus]CBW26467.1 hypothetical protein BMS_1623 [Halobacteriovorax marinus SJ]
MKKILFWATTFILLICVTEASLFLVAKSLDLYQESDFNPSKTKILVLGESTSVNYLGHTSWPTQLQEILNNKDKEVSVINKAKAGTNTFALKKSLKYNLAKYDPDIVITLMGINDLSPYNINPNRKSFIDSMKRLRVFKLFSEVLKVIDPFLMDYQVHYLDRENHLLCLFHDHPKNLLSDSLRDLEEKDVNQYINSVEDRITEPRDQAIQLAYMAQKYNRHKMHSASEATIPLKLLEESLIRASNINIALDQYLYYLNQTKQYDRCFMASKFVDKNKKVLTYFTLRRLYECYAKSKIENKKEIWKKLLSHFKLEYKQIKKSDEFTMNNYRKIGQILEKSEIPFIAIQYPNLPISQIKNYFEDSDIEPNLFISNQRNFQEKLEEHSYDTLFTDNFAGDFGHLTTKGHRVIAMEVARALLNKGYLE